MKFDKAEGGLSKCPRIVIAEDEIERAQEGFEATGSQRLSDWITLPTHPIEGTIGRITPQERALLVIVGNLALARSLREQGESIRANTTLRQAQQTVETGLGALLDADGTTGIMTS